MCDDRGRRQRHRTGGAGAADRSLLCTETRTATTDPASTRQFRRYWTVIGPFAGYIMRHWLTLANQHAEQGQ